MNTVMTSQLSAAELQTAQNLLQDYAPAHAALSALNENDGDLETSLEALVAAEAGTEAYGMDLERLRVAFVKNL